MIRVMHEEHAFSDLFLSFLLARSMRTQADLVDQLFNSSEKRLARILLLMAEFGKPGERETFIPPVTQETLAEMIGTTRSRVSFFMNRFRKLGFIDYNGRIQVHKSLLNVFLLDQLPEHNSQTPPVVFAQEIRSANHSHDQAVQATTPTTAETLRPMHAQVLQTPLKLMEFQPHSAHPLSNSTLHQIRSGSARQGRGVSGADRSAQ
jgi:hypothetical protein